MPVANSSHVDHGHKVSRVSAKTGHQSPVVPAKPSYAAASAQPGGVGQLVPSGQKALGMRAKKILAPLADPNQAIAE